MSAAAEGREKRPKLIVTLTPDADPGAVQRELDRLRGLPVIVDPSRADGIRADGIRPDAARNGTGS